MSICSITPENFRYFRPLLPKSYADSFDNDPYVYGIGHYEGDAARGIILYDMDYENHVAGIRYVAVDMKHQPDDQIEFWRSSRDRMSFAAIAGRQFCRPVSMSREVRFSLGSRSDSL